MNMTRFSRDFIKTAVDYKIADENKLRDYDMLKDHQKGSSFQQLAIKYGMSKRGVMKALDKYR